MSRAYIRKQFDAIVDFAELEEAIDTPVKMYSSGMQLRLGFSIASHLDPDVFVVDEALAVGDAGFQAKCVERMTKLVSEGRTLLFVSHNLSAVEAICRRAIFLLEGRVVLEADVKSVLRKYLDWIDSTHQARLARTMKPMSSERLVLEEMTCHDSEGRERYAFRTGEDVEIRLRFHSADELKRPHVSIGITDGRPGGLVLCSMLVDGGTPDRIEGETVVLCRLRSLPLLPRVYELWCSVRSAQAFGDLFDWQQVGAFRVVEAPALTGPAALAHTATDGPVYVAHEWNVISCR
jgi:lipopolysaccharide transport system ATP-binding protein